MKQFLTVMGDIARGWVGVILLTPALLISLSLLTLIVHTGWTIAKFVWGLW